ncbi:CaiB/BaiF CoA-transferase family protein [uncultured Ramlibacter sp.]|uniref:CaiB/BaiF CoA transferase family protein n=1 Tax=uncultured Ramlibacter sp. TaxID=260755 RepID=UPI00261C045B|nr:CaiB/BaiF CoA-transferase family protein [uncultured Ramlibacter sp.]
MWPATPDRGGALHGVKVVDLTRVLAGPLCTQILSDHGADVIKVEPPAGDDTRRLGPPFDSRGEAAYFGALNRGKRGLSLDLGQPLGREVLARLLEDADVLVENFLPGTMERWGLGYEEVLSRQYPRLVYCAVTGFGADGPLGQLPGYDAVLQAMCGLMSVNGEASQGPTRMGVPVVDHLTGYVALSGILMALNGRHRTGRGQRVEATLFDTAISLLLPHAANWMASGTAPALLGSAHPNIAPYDKFTAADGQVFIGIVNDAQFRRFCSHIAREDIAADARFATNAQRVAHRAELRAWIEPVLHKLPAAALCEDLMRLGVPAGQVNTVPQALGQAHAQHRQLVVERGAYKGIRSPALLHGTPATPGDGPPLFAQHSADILRGLGFTEEEIKTLKSTGAAPPAN